MKEIAFRCWDKKLKKMFPVEFMGLDDTMCKQHTGRYATDFIMMQYTTLKDKNDVKIYEGDIVIYNWGKEIGKIIFYNYGFCIENINSPCEIFLLSSSNVIIEVIGNEFECVWHIE